MLKSWYYNKKNGQRFLPIEEVAEACSCSVLKAQDWFAGKLQHCGNNKSVCVDASEIVAFIVRNSMPVPQGILPPNTRKLLFILPDNTRLKNEEKHIANVLQFFQNIGNLLVENSSTGHFAGLSILTFVPNIVVYFLDSYDRTSKATLALLINFPDLSLILFAGKTALQALDDEDISSSKNILVRDDVLEHQFLSQLHATYSQS
jgi:hypothetical protein